MTAKQPDNEAWWAAFNALTPRQRSKVLDFGHPGTPRTTEETMTKKHPVPGAVASPRIPTPQEACAELSRMIANPPTKGALHQLTNMYTPKQKPVVVQRLDEIEGKIDNLVEHVRQLAQPVVAFEMPNGQMGTKPASPEETESYEKRKLPPEMAALVDAKVSAPEEKPETPFGRSVLPAGSYWLADPREENWLPSPLFRVDEDTPTTLTRESRKLHLHWLQERGKNDLAPVIKQTVVDMRALRMVIPPGVIDVGELGPDDFTFIGLTPAEIANLRDELAKGNEDAAISAVLQHRADMDADAEAAAEEQELDRYRDVNGKRFDPKTTRLDGDHWRDADGEIVPIEFRLEDTKPVTPPTLEAQLAEFVKLVDAVAEMSTDDAFSGVVKSVQSSLAYSPPENAHLHLDRFNYALHDNGIFDATEGWKLEVWNLVQASQKSIAAGYDEVPKKTYTPPSVKSETIASETLHEDGSRTLHNSKGEPMIRVEDQTFDIEPDEPSVIARIVGWQEETFPTSTLSSVLKHLDKEAYEECVARARVAVAEDFNRPHNAGGVVDAHRKELVDRIFLCLAALKKLEEPNRPETAPEAALEAVLADNQTRVWKEPDADGCVHHEKDDAGEAVRKKGSKKNVRRSDGKSKPLSRREQEALEMGTFSPNVMGKRLSTGNVTLTLTSWSGAAGRGYRTAPATFQFGDVSLRLNYEYLRSHALKHNAIAKPGQFELIGLRFTFGIHSERDWIVLRVWKEEPKEETQQAESPEDFGGEDYPNV